MASSRVGHDVIEEAATAFVHEPSARLACPICTETLRAPALTPCRHTFCTHCIFQAVALKPECPLCRAVLGSDDIHPNLLVQDLLDEMDVYCPFRSAGCTAIFPLAELEAHRVACASRPARCPFRKHGCAYAATWDAVNAHTAPDGDCPYAKVTTFISETCSKIEVLEDALARKSEEVDALRAALLALASADAAGPVASIAPELRALLEENLPEPIATRLGLGQSASVCAGASASAAVADEPEPGTPSLRSRALSATAGLEVWSPTRLECARTLKGHTSGVTALCVGSAYLYSGSQDTTIRVWSLETFECLAVLQGHAYTVWALEEAFVPVPDEVYSDYDDDSDAPHVSRRLFSASSDFSILVWVASPAASSAPHFERVGKLEVHTAKIYALRYEPLANVLISGDASGTLCFTHAWSLAVLASVKIRDAGISALTRAGDLLYIASDDGTVSLLDISRLLAPLADVSNLELPEPVVVVQAESKILALALAGDYLFASCSYTIGVYNMAREYEFEGVLKGHRWPVWQMEVVTSSANTWLVSASFDHRIMIWAVDPDHCVRTLDAHHGYIHALAQRPAASADPRHILASGSGDRTIRVWIPVVAPPPAASSSSP
ncbi:atypical/Alpha/MHCK protein kinase [Thecamonas trahens ATCC 50062]|uniref:Atypical/Alpha/MHCK protein kinase n=1 Tax=Thecamonas trahens ATCC 50062 TaxID=461836 RepID=A0A0L0D9E8_THETB|nr:atypical/Alpha/MHCK protein kinase [Thecamonas trahens ATCC 50062]KNC48676.1 atypical/Alpha/MHCK protein kinase [Thecamonas trahens ATCC 50062]|eukprot:XP_013762732.1 atypical/Alpha/MHCK protein kinase [Thecamonas trahens ATCC 50062]